MSGYQALQNKKWPRKKKNKKKNEKNFIISFIFVEAIQPYREVGNLSYRLKKILIAKICLKVVFMMKSPSVNV